MRLVRETWERKPGPALLADALATIAAPPTENRDFVDQNAGQNPALQRPGAEANERASLALGIGFRVQDLDWLTADCGGRGWIRPGEPGHDLIHEDLVRCAVEEPLVETGGGLAFDAESFHTRLAGFTETRGIAGRPERGLSDPR